jgi:hypothetical protein
MEVKNSFDSFINQLTSRNSVVMNTSDDTLQECFDLELAGAQDIRFSKTQYKDVEVGDVIFLHNVSRSDRIYGPFIAKTTLRKNINQSAWNGEFTLQVKLVIQRPIIEMTEASEMWEDLEKDGYISIYRLRNGIYVPSVRNSKSKRFDASITRKVLQMMMKYGVTI